MRRNAPAGVFYKRPEKTSEMQGRYGDLEFLRHAGTGFAWVRCDKGHETLKDSGYMRRYRAGKKAAIPRCSECVRLAAEAKQSERMGWPREPEAAE